MQVNKDEINSLKHLYRKDTFVSMLLDEIEKVKKINTEQAAKITRQTKRLKDFEIKPSKRRKSFDKQTV
jgi:hypothetical protein